MKKGTKLLRAMLSLFGAGAVLTACSFDANQSNVPTTSINKDVKSDTTEVSETEETSSTTQSQTEASESSTSEEIIDPAQLLHYEEEIETKLKNKLNDRIGMEYVTNVDAKYFTLKDVDSTKVLEANGSISIVGKQEESEVSLGLPITVAQYQTLSNEDFMSHSASSDLAENYNLQNLHPLSGYGRLAGLLDGAAANVVWHPRHRADGGAIRFAHPPGQRLRFRNHGRVAGAALRQSLTTGELYLSKADKDLLGGHGNQIGSYSPIQELAPQPPAPDPI